MSDAEAYLIELKFQFYTLERELALPSDDPVAWRATHKRMTELAVQINRALQGVTGPERLRIDTAASKAAREQLPPLPVPEPEARPDQDSAGG